MSGNPYADFSRDLSRADAQHELNELSAVMRDVGTASPAGAAFGGARTASAAAAAGYGSLQPVNTYKPNNVTYEAFVPPQTTQINIHLSPSKRGTAGAAAAASAYGATSGRTGGGGRTTIDITAGGGGAARSAYPPQQPPPPQQQQQRVSPIAFPPDGDGDDAEDEPVTSGGAGAGAIDAKYPNAAASQLYISDEDMNKHTNSRAVLAALRALQSKISSVQQEKKALEDRLAEFSDSGLKRDADMKFKFETQIRQLQRAAIEAQTSHSEHVRELHATEDRLQRQLHDQEKRYKTQIAALEKERNGLEEKLRSSEHARAAALEDRAKAVRELEASEQERSAVDGRVVELHKAMSVETGASAKRIHELEAANSIIKSRSDELEATSAKLRREYQKLGADFQALTKDLQNEKLSRLALEKERIQNTEQMRSLRTALDATERNAREQLNASAGGDGGPVIRTTTKFKAHIASTTAPAAAAPTAAAPASGAGGKPKSGAGSSLFIHRKPQPKAKAGAAAASARASKRGGPASAYTSASGARVKTYRASIPLPFVTAGPLSATSFSLPANVSQLAKDAVLLNTVFKSQTVRAAAGNDDDDDAAAERPPTITDRQLQLRDIQSQLRAGEPLSGGAHAHQHATASAASAAARAHARPASAGTSLVHTSGGPASDGVDYVSLASAIAEQQFGVRRGASPERTSRAVGGTPKKLRDDTVDKRLILNLHVSKQREGGAAAGSANHSFANTSAGAAAGAGAGAVTETPSLQAVISALENDIQSLTQQYNDAAADPSGAGATAAILKQIDNKKREVWLLRRHQSATAEQQLASTAASLGAGAGAGAGGAVYPPAPSAGDGEVMVDATVSPAKPSAGHVSGTAGIPLSQLLRSPNAKVNYLQKVRSLQGFTSANDH